MDNLASKVDTVLVENFPLEKLLARKGLANCLKDKDGTTRPFSFIALGGSSNGSTLSGHNYTYVGFFIGEELIMIY